MYTNAKYISTENKLNRKCRKAEMRWKCHNFLKIFAKCYFSIHYLPKKRGELCSRYSYGQIRLSRTKTELI